MISDSGKPVYTASICGISRSTAEAMMSLPSSAFHRPFSYRPRLPALPTICCISAGLSSLVSVPSNLLISRNTSLSIGRFIPIPMASVATTTSVSPALNLLASSCRTSYGRFPYITLHLIPIVLSSPATACTFRLENTIRASCLRIYSLNSLNFELSMTRGVCLS